jgi:predicted GNAT family N-acyltransferase
MNAIVGPLKPVQAAPSPLVSVSVARTLDDLMQVMSIRSLVYLGGQDCPYAEEFDGNDFAGSTHLVARQGREPIGTIRIRWFAGFAKIERAGVRADRRCAGAGRALMDRALKLAADKGYRRIISHGQVQLTDHWTRTAGFRVRSDRPGFTFSDHDYVELERDLPETAGAIDADVDPLVLNRPEGEWDRPGVLDHSAARAVGAAA